MALAWTLKSLVSSQTQASVAVLAANAVFSALPLWILASLGLGGCAALVPFATQYRKMQFQAGHFLIAFFGKGTLVILSALALELAGHLRPLLERPSIWAMGSIVCFFAIAPIFGILDSRLPWRWRGTMGVLMVSIFMPLSFELRHYFGIPRQYLFLFSNCVGCVLVLSYVLSLITELILWACSRSRHDWLHRLGVLMPLLFVGHIFLSNLIVGFVRST